MNGELELLTSEEAGKIIGVTARRARTLLDHPDDIEMTRNGSPVYLYCRCRICQVARDRQLKQQCKACEHGKKSCYICRRKFHEAEMRSRVCLECQAKRTIKNFVSCGSCERCKLDPERLLVLAEQVRKFSIPTSVQAGK